MRTMRILGMLAAGLLVAALQVQAVEGGGRVGAVHAAVLAGPGPVTGAMAPRAVGTDALSRTSGKDGAPARVGDAKADIWELMDKICRQRQTLQRNVCIEHCESQGMWGWYDDPGNTCGYGARCTCVYYAEVQPGK